MKLFIITAATLLTFLAIALMHEQREDARTRMMVPASVPVLAR